MGLQVWDNGKSERRLVMSWIVVERWVTSTLPHYASRQTSVLVSLGEDRRRIHLEKKANVSSGNTCLCASRRAISRGHHHKYRAGHVGSDCISQEVFKRLRAVCAERCKHGCGGEGAAATSLPYPTARTVLRRGSGSNVTLLSDLDAAHHEQSLNRQR